MPRLRVVERILDVYEGELHVSAPGLCSPVTGSSMIGYELGGSVASRARIPVDLGTGDARPRRLASSYGVLMGSRPGWSDVARHRRCQAYRTSESERRCVDGARPQPPTSTRYFSDPARRTPLASGLGGPNDDMILVFDQAYEYVIRVHEGIPYDRPAYHVPGGRCVATPSSSFLRALGPEIPLESFPPISEVQQ